MRVQSERGDRRHGRGRIIWGEALGASDPADPSAITEASWIWHRQGRPAESAPTGAMLFRREFTVPTDRKVTAARFEMTADNSFALP